jgi:uncharacterized protein
MHGFGEAKFHKEILENLVLVLLVLSARFPREVGSVCVTCPGGQGVEVMPLGTDCRAPRHARFTPPVARPYSLDGQLLHSSNSENEGLAANIMRMADTRRILSLLLCFAAIAVSAQISPAEDLTKIHPTGYVTDLAGTLSDEAKANLEALGTELEQKTGAQMAIITVHSLEGRTVEDYAVDLYKKLGIGSKKDDRGVLLLLAPDERKYRIEVGYGLEPVINDARAGDVGRAMVPYLRANDFNTATETAAWQLAKFIADDRGATLSGRPLAHAVPSGRGNVPSSIGIWIFLIVVVLFLVVIGRGGGGGLLWFLLGMLTSGGGGGGGYRGGGFGGGGGGYSGGGGFGGFGGGSSGGGGASGSW